MGRRAFDDDDVQRRSVAAEEPREAGRQLEEHAADGLVVGVACEGHHLRALGPTDGVLPRHVRRRQLDRRLGTLERLVSRVYEVRALLDLDVGDVLFALGRGDVHLTGGLRPERARRQPDLLGIRHVVVHETADRDTAVRHRVDVRRRGEAVDELHEEAARHRRAAVAPQRAGARTLVATQRVEQLPVHVVRRHDAHLDRPRPLRHQQVAEGEHRDEHEKDTGQDEHVIAMHGVILGRTLATLSSKRRPCPSPGRSEGEHARRRLARA